MDRNRTFVDKKQTFVCQKSSFVGQKRGFRVSEMPILCVENRGFVCRKRRLSLYLVELNIHFEYFA